MKKIMLKVITFVLILGLILTGCSNKETEKKAEDLIKIVQDENYTTDLKKEKEIKDGQVYIQNDTVMCVMIINDDVKEADAKELLNKYAKELKEKYKDMPVNAQAVLNGKNIGNIILDK